MSGTVVPYKADVLNFSNPEDIRHSAVSLLCVGEKAHLRDEACELVTYFLMKCPELKSYYKQFIDTLNHPIQRDADMLRQGQGQLLKGKIRHCGTYYVSVHCRRLVCVCFAH